MVNQSESVDKSLIYFRIVLERIFIAKMILHFSNGILCKILHFSNIKSGTILHFSNFFNTPYLGTDALRFRAQEWHG